jgi:valyl-tRNA synthetase
MEPLAHKAIDAVRDGRIKIVPERFEKVYFNWLENIKDWCISRQLWWGHRIPAFYCPDGHITVARQAPTRCATCGSRQLEQDPDVLDTWFSSGLWPFSTLGWPSKRRTYALPDRRAGRLTSCFSGWRMIMMFGFSPTASVHTVSCGRSRRRRQNEQNQRQRDRSADHDGQVWYGCGAVRADHGRHAGQRHEPV